jgi:hypothetical protein
MYAATIATSTNNALRENRGQFGSVCMTAF